MQIHLKTLQSMQHGHGRNLYKLCTRAHSIFVDFIQFMLMRKPWPAAKCVLEARVLFLKLIKRICALLRRD